ncbi:MULTISPECIES: DUF2884 family protein [unclassified Pseudoalteromonas]|jgi:hypothetical protein|uniref:DUF2884 family protein n=1 Tax=unclassified Pseudoalteromonas TaxID=194690 RepID=UPI0005A996FE|nr:MULTISPECIES: DUF2884 family protein [unclassified Pseudoalteromonas]
MFNKLRIGLFLVLFGFYFLSFSVVADEECNVELEHGLIITENVIRIVDKTQTRVQINLGENQQDTQIFIKGLLIELSEDETLVLNEFERGLRNTVPELVNLATDGVNLGLTAIEQVVKGFSDKEPQVLKNQLEYVEKTLMSKFKRGDDFFYIAPQSLSRLDDFFKNEISEKIHAAVHGSLGAILVALGDAFESDEGNLEERITDMGTRMDIIATEIDKSLQKKAMVLEAKADEYCSCLQKLDETETRLQKIIPSLLQFDLVKIKPKYEL